MFLDAKLTGTANRHVKNGPVEALPVFRRTVTGLVEVGGSILRYSTTTGETEHKPTPKRAKARAALAQIAKAGVQ